MKYFGTDGIRGVYGVDLTDELAKKTGAAVAKYFGKGKFIIVRDSRISGTALENAVAEGIILAGGTAIIAGILPTPACSFLVRKYNARCGVVISASHNPPKYNGIKIFDSTGLKPDEDKEAAIEKFIDLDIDSLKGKYGEKKVLESAKEEYIDFVSKAADKSFEGVSLMLDCGYGATSFTAKEIFTRLGAKVVSQCDDYIGEKINCDCGALHPELLLSKMQDETLGLSFDGDGDRLSVVYDGEVIDGDSIIYNLSKSIKPKHNTVVGTILNNLALEKALNKDGIAFARTPVGDKYISNLMREKDYTLGGEQSGHFIIMPEGAKYCVPTGDAILSAVFLISSMLEDGKIKPLKKLDLMPQLAIALEADGSIMKDQRLIDLKTECDKLLGDTGRIILRMSGTEPKIRVMVEGEDFAIIKDVIDRFGTTIKLITKK